MNRIATLTVLGFLIAPMVHGAPSNDELEALQAELRAAREQLAETSRKMQELYGDRIPGEYPGNSFSFSYSSDPRPMLGVVLVSDRDGEGVKLGGVTPGAPADEAGLESGDRLISINGHALRGRNARDEANDLLSDMQEGDSFDIVYERDGKRHEVTVEAALHEPSYAFNFGSGSGPAISLPNLNLRMQDFNADQFRDWASKQRDWALQLRNMPQLEGLGVRPFVWQFGWAWAGLELAPINEQLGEYFATDRGVLVIETEGLDEIGLEPGDVILEINGIEVDSPGKAMKRLQRLDAGEKASVQIVRHQDLQTITVVGPEPSEENSFEFSWSDDD